MAPAVSSFTYAITRPYPYPRFKWVVVVCGILATTLFTVINLAATGYVLRVTYTSNWNSTMNERKWFQQQPIALIANTQTSCQSLDLQIQSSFFTDKRNFRYTLNQVWQYENSSHDVITLPSLSYTNNAIENCMVNAIRLQLESTSRTAEQVGWTDWGVFATASIRCSVDNSQVPIGKTEALGPTWFNLTVQYEFVGPDGNIDPQLGSSAKLSELDNQITWWGRSLMEWYWLAAVYEMDRVAKISPVAMYNKGFITITPRIGDADIASPDFLGNNVTFKFVNQNITMPGMPIRNASIPQNAPHTIEHYVAINQEPNIWREVDNFARSFYSIILADLGQNSRQNILLDTEALQYFTKNFSSLAMNKTETPWLKAGPARSAYAKSYPLAVNASYIYTNYLCQVPQLKSNGALFISILIADLVFLQTAWKVLTWITTKMVERRDPRAHFSTGCLACVGTDSSITMDETRHSLDSGKTVADHLANQDAATTRRSGFCMWTERSPSEPHISILGSRYTRRSTWQDKALSSEAIAISDNPGTKGGYARLGPDR